jgi:hypothetical protein
VIRFEKSLRAWGTADFADVLKREILLLGADGLPLQQGLSTGNYVADEPIAVVINSVAAADDAIRVRAGIFYAGVIGGCSCTDDPTPASNINEYCEVLLEIDMRSAATAIVLADGN